MSDFSRMTLFLVDHPRIAELIYSGSSESEAMPRNDPDDKQRALYYLDGLLGLLERAWWASKTGKARKGDWIGWRNWLKSLAEGPLFAELLTGSEEEWDPEWRAELACILREIQVQKAK